MYSEIKKTKSLSVCLRYNEQKVTDQKATLLLAGNFLKDADQLTFEEKLYRLQQRIVLNQAAVKPTIHAFLSMHHTEQLTDEKFKAIAVRYMEGIDFGEQPYLVYRHHDMPHPHVHIVSTSIRQDRTIITPTRREMYSSQQLTRQLEKEFSLIPYHAATKEELRQYQVKQAGRVTYAGAPLNRAISDVLNTVIDHYKYTSMDELNAILRQYNVRADRGNEGSNLYKDRRLVYYALDNNGRRLSKGIGASFFSLKPTLPYLENKFSQNQALHESQHRRITTAIEWAFAGKPPDWGGFEQAMQREGINIIVQEATNKRPADIYFIDHQGKSVFSGAGLGAEFTLKAIRERCAQEQQLQQEETQRHHLKLRL